MESDISSPGKTIIVGVATPGNKDFEDIMEELERLVEALGLEVCARFTQELPSPNPGTYIGTGKLEELYLEVENRDAGYVVFADTLSPAQLKNIADKIDAVIYDRTGLILEIFSRRAGTREARLQVETAHLQYMLPRLVGMRTSLGRQAGNNGSRSNRGQGEKQLELDRRHIENRISELRRLLDDIQHDKEVQRKARSRSNLPQVALVGYTNAGKSTLMNRMLDLSQSTPEKKVFEKDMLFATLDTSVRKISTGDCKDFLLSDTVGFVSNLPHGLIKAFRSTLDEVRLADLLLIVLDAHDANWNKQLDITLDTLKELEADTIPRILVMNKSDLLETAPAEGYDAYNDRIYISAADGSGLELLLRSIKEKVYGGNSVRIFLIPYSDGNILNTINEHAHIIDREYLPEGVRVSADCPGWLSGKYVEYIVEQQ